MTTKIKRQCNNCHRKTEEQKCYDCPARTRPASLKIQGDIENGIFTVDVFCQPFEYIDENQLLEPDFNFKSMNNSAIEITNPFLIDQFSSELRHMSSARFEKHILLTYF